MRPWPRAAARRLLGVARYAGVELPVDVEGAALVLERVARTIEQQVAREVRGQQRSGLDEAGYQRELERRPRRPAPGRPARTSAAGGDA
jgi:hypothetical protein